MWGYILRDMRFKRGWCGDSFISVLENWRRRNKDYMEISIMACWEKWKTRNRAIFEDRQIHANLVSQRIISSTEMIPNSSLSKIRTKSPPYFQPNCCKVFFMEPCKMRLLVVVLVPLSERMTKFILSWWWTVKLVQILNQKLWPFEFFSFFANSRGIPL